jgi:HSP20 family protein
MQPERGALKGGAIMKLVRRNIDRPMVRPYGEFDPVHLWKEMLGWEPFRDIAAPIGRVDTLFVPAFEVKEIKDAYMILADLPGVKEADLEVRVIGAQVVISGKREVEENVDNDTFYVFERTYGTFTRTFVLPEGADLEHIVAALKEGVLTLHIPKKPGVLPRKVPIEVKKIETH